MAKAIDLYMVSGFFGSGKTTLLQNLLGYFIERKTGVLVNEAGQISIDTERLKKEELELTEITNGSIYCACLKGEFVRALVEMSAKDTEVLLIENSGMSDPANIHRILKETEGMVKRPYHYCGSICVVNAVSFLKHIRVLVALENQVRASNCVLVNKADLTGSFMLEVIHRTIQQINPSAHIHDTCYADIPAETVIRELADTGYDADSSNKCSEKPFTCVFEWSDEIREKDLYDFIFEASKEAYRIKGCVLTEHGWRQADAEECQVDFHDAVREHPDYSRLVIVMQGKNDRKDKLRQAWEQYCHVPVTVMD